MKRLLLFFLFSGIFGISLFGQYVSIEGRQFKDENGDDFYPLVCNYIVYVVNNDINNFSTTFISPEFAWGSTPSLDCFNTPDCNEQLKHDFKQLLSMGFNAIRIMGLGPVFIPAGTVMKSYDIACNWTCPESAFYIFSPSYNGNCSNDKWFKLQEPYNDVVSQRLFRHIANILQVAAETEYNGKKLKVILLTGGASGNYSIYFPNEYLEYLEVLASTISSLESEPAKKALLAYDMFNEPTSSWNWQSLWPNMTIGHSKQDVCNNVKSWYNSLKTFDPDHLITFGGIGVDDIFEFDPSVLTIDFYSSHIYPKKRPFESSTISYNMILNRIKGSLFWFQNNLPMPWIIGETGFLAQNSWTYPEVDGTLLQQKNYAEETLDLVRQGNGSGYSWWTYQNLHWGNPSQNFYGIFDYGLCTPVPCRDNAKPVYHAFEDFVAQPPGILSEPDFYFDPYNHQQYNQNTKIVTGYVFDSNNPPHPIEGALIKGYTRLRNYIDENGKLVTEFDVHYTFTDETGKFSLIPYDYNPEPPDYNSIEAISISAPGCSRVRSECWNCENGIPNNQTFILNKTDLKYQDIYENLIIQGGGNLLQAWDKVYLKNISIQKGAACEIKARTEIYVDVEFFALEGSETWIHTNETFAQCEKISSSYSKNTIVINECN